MSGYKGPGRTFPASSNSDAGKVPVADTTTGPSGGVNWKTGNNVTFEPNATYWNGITLPTNLGEAINTLAASVTLHSLVTN